MIKVVIDIDEDVFTRLFDNGTEDYAIVNDDLFAIAKAIRNGKPLSKHHGRLGDLDELERKMTEYISTLPLPYNEAERIVLLMNFFDDAPTVIEADKEE